MAGGALPALQAPGSSIRVLKPSSRGQACGACKLASLRRRQARRCCHAPALATAAPEKGYQREASVRTPPSEPPKEPKPGPVLVAVTVPNCRLGSGEELRLVGDSPELGGWELAAAPPLSRSPDGSTWQVVLPLMPGQYQCKLVIARSNRGSVVCWEGGPNRQLRVPHLGGLEVPPGVPLWQGVCRFGDTSKTQLKASPSVHPQQLKDAATAAVQRCAELAEKRDTLTARLDHLAHEVESSEVRVASKRGELQQMVADELAHLKQRGLVSQQVARLQGGAAAAPAAAPAAPAAAAGPRAAAPPPRREPQPEQPLAAAAAQPAKQAVHSGGTGASASQDGGSEFRFQGQQGGEAGPSAFQLAKQQLMELLPAEAEAALEARWQREQRAAAAAHAQPAAAPPSAGAVPKPAALPAPRPSAAAGAAAPVVAAPKPDAKPQPQSAPAAASLVASAAAAKAAAAKAAAAKAAAAKAAALKAAATANRVKVVAAPAAAKPAASPTTSAPAASSAAAAPADKAQQAAHQGQAAQSKAEAAVAPAAPRRSRSGDISSVMNKPSMPVVAVLAVGQQMFQAYRALWGCALAAALPTPAAQRGVDTLAAVTLGVVASIPFWG